MKKKLLHIMMGNHNPEFAKGLDCFFECVHQDWTKIDRISLPNEVYHCHKDFNPDYVFMHIQSGDVLPVDFIKELSTKSKVVNWTGDVRYPLPNHYIEIGKNIHLTLFTNLNDVETCKLNGVNADFLQVGFDNLKFNPIGRKDKKYPKILFLGSNYPSAGFPLSQLRREMVFALKERFGDDFGVYGGGWEQYGNGNITNYDDEGTAYRSCKIAINLSHFAYKRYSSDRLYRILGSGAFCLSHNYPDVEKDFVINKDLVLWNSISELIEKINYYLDKDEEREKIALNGCYVAHTQYTWNKFAENLKLILEKI
jgi:spore maturation protein CgeB